MVLGESITDKGEKEPRLSLWHREMEALAAEGGKQQIAAHQHSSKETGAWLLCYGLLVYSCLRTEMSTWSSMPIRQPELLQLLTTGSLPAACNSVQLFPTTHLCQAMSLLRFLGFTKGSNPVWNRCVPLRGKFCPAPGCYLWSVRELSGLRRTMEGILGDKLKGSAPQTLDV